MFIEFYNSSTNRGVCFECVQIDMIDFRVQLRSDGPWYFIGSLDGDFKMAGEYWPHLGVSDTVWKYFKQISHMTAVESLLRAS